MKKAADRFRSAAECLCKLIDAVGSEGEVGLEEGGAGLGHVGRVLAAGGLHGGGSGSR